MKINKCPNCGCKLKPEDWFPWKHKGKEYKYAECPICHLRIIPKEIKDDFKWDDFKVIIE
ncbi:MAG: hypothetical protein DRJ60_00320 [Thermoprotei archaeon]|nr:MAG: hypothetical protein DRJ60_00320 [Thermoprotei archaeon]